MNLVLIGYRGTGKSCVARRLAERLGWAWVDADDELERRAGRSIAAIFAGEGEAAFRDLESEVIADLCRRDRTVIAAGGGAVLREQNRRWLTSTGRVAWLRATPETILRRVAADASTAARRPQLTTQGGAAEVELLLAERTPLYEACADVRVDTDARSPDEVAAEVLALLGLAGSA